MATALDLSVNVHLSESNLIDVWENNGVCVSIKGEGYPSAALYMSLSKARELTAALNAYCDAHPLAVAA